jgi:hypothetical protein
MALPLVQHRLPASLLMALVAIAIGSFAAGAEVDSHIVLPPLSPEKTSLPEKMLIFMPGGKVPNEKYVSTAKAIQQSADQLRLWVVIPGIFQRLCIISCSATSICSPLHSAVEAALGMAKERGWTRGKDGEDTWLAGHSLGGVCANTLFQAYTKKGSSDFPYAGLIVMGSYVDEAGDHDLLHYPVPALTLNVELDGGLARPGKTAVWWRQHLALQASHGEEYALAHKPVIVLPKLNHSDFCPGFNVPGDLMAEVSQAEATAEIGRVVGAFLHVQTSASSAAAATAPLEVLRERVAWTKNLLEPYLEAQAYERRPTDTRWSAEGASPLCAEAQHIVAGLSEKDDKRLDVQDGFHVKSSNFEHCHPNWTATAGKLSVRSCGHADYYADIDNTGSITAASEVACKLLSSARVAQQLSTSASQPSVECREINMHAVRLAESLAAKSTLERYRRIGRGWCFLEDEPVTGNIGPLFVFTAALKLTSNATCMAVASPVLKTELDGKIYPGNHYCKVLSPARALDWMMTDGLKREGGLAAAPAGGWAPLWV